MRDQTAELREDLLRLGKIWEYLEADSSKFIGIRVVSEKGLQILETTGTFPHRDLTLAGRSDDQVDELEAEGEERALSALARQWDEEVRPQLETRGPGGAPITPRRDPFKLP